MYSSVKSGSWFDSAQLCAAIVHAVTVSFFETESKRMAYPDL
jgi:hypothetical protein